jgi:tetratricopeptide (TPR) repeat protein
MDDAEAQLRSTLEDARGLGGAEGERRVAQVLGILARQLADTSGFLRGREELVQAVQGLSRLDPDGIDLIDAQVLQAQFRLRSGDEDGGLEALAAAVARFERHPDANLVNLDFFRSQLSRGYLQCERFAAALPLLQQGFEASLRSAGPGSLHAVVWQRSVAMAQFGDNQVEAAVETLQAMRQAARGSESPAVAAYEGAALHQLAQIEFAAGRFDTAVALIAESLEVLQRTNPRGVILRSAQRSAAAMHIALGQGSAADRELEAIAREHAAQGTQASDDAAMARLDRAWLQLLRGHFDAVQAVVEAELAAPEPPHFGRVGVHRVARALLARCLAWRGEVASAIAMFEPLLAELEAEGATRSARRLAIEMRLALGGLLLDRDRARSAQLSAAAWRALRADRLHASELAHLAGALSAASGAPELPEGPAPSPLLAEHLVNPRFRPPGGR